MQTLPRDIRARLVSSAKCGAGRSGKIAVPFFHQGGVGHRLPFLVQISARFLSTAKADKNLLSKLRKKTGFSFINCKKALEQFDNDIDQAEKWLKEQAQKEGWAKATKLQTRSMSQGLIAITGNNQAATMIEMNCETDFVARNSKFVNLTAQLAHECHQSFVNLPSPAILLARSVLGEMPTSTGKKLADIVALEVGNIGENMALRRAVHYKGDQAIISSYVHASGPEIVADRDCHLGKYGVLIRLNQGLQKRVEYPDDEQSSPLPIDRVGHLLGQHIVGMNPRLVGLPEEEKEEEEGKDEEKREEEDRLLRQEFLLDSNKTVGQIVEENNVAVEAFTRFACGEELPEETH